MLSKRFSIEILLIEQVFYRKSSDRTSFFYRNTFYWTSLPKKVFFLSKEFFLENLVIEGFPIESFVIQGVFYKKTCYRTRYLRKGLLSNECSLENLVIEVIFHRKPCCWMSFFIESPVIERVFCYRSSFSYKVLLSKGFSIKILLIEWVSYKNVIEEVFVIKYYYQENFRIQYHRIYVLYKTRKRFFIVFYYFFNFVTENVFVRDSVIDHIFV